MLSGDYAFCLKVAGKEVICLASEFLGTNWDYNFFDILRVAIVMMLSYPLRVSKYATYLIALFSVPLILEIDYVLTLWLKNPLILAHLFCRAMLVVMLIEKMTVGQMVAVAAKGKIAGHQVMLGGFLILTLPLAWLFLHNGRNAVSVMWAFLITIAACSIGRVFWTRHLVGMSVLKWFKEVFLACVIVITTSLSLGYAVRYIIPEECFFRLAVTTACTLATSGILGCFIIVSKTERAFILRNVIKTLNKVGFKHV